MPFRERDFAAELFAAAVDLLERHHSIGRHALGDQRRVRPEEVVGKMIDPRGRERALPFLSELVRPAGHTRRSEPSMPG